MNGPLESLLLVSGVSQLSYNLFPVMFLVVNIMLETLPYLVAEEL